MEFFGSAKLYRYKVKPVYTMPV